jgi:hypothetical protein
MSLYPPRPETHYFYGTDAYRRLQQDPNWIGQPKVKGQRNLIYFVPGGPVQLWSRHGRDHRNYSLSTSLAQELRETVRVDPNKWSVLDSELLHAKVAGGEIKDTFLVWDILVHNNSYLIRTTYGERYQQVLDICGARDTPVKDWYIPASPHLWVAPCVPPEQWDRWWSEHIEDPYIEGFVFKDLNAKLSVGLSEKNNGSWNIRCKKADSVGPSGNRTHD